MARHLWSQPTSCASPPHLANTDWDKIGEGQTKVGGGGIWGGKGRNGMKFCHAKKFT